MCHSCSASAPGPDDETRGWGAHDGRVTAAIPGKKSHPIHVCGIVG
jgi:hypothetical protein